MNCPQCGHRFDSHAAIGRPATPKPGDRSICIGCSAINVYETTPYGLRLRAATLEELDETLRRPDIREALAALREVRSKEGRV